LPLCHRRLPILASIYLSFTFPILGPLCCYKGHYIFVLLSFKSALANHSIHPPRLPIPRQAIGPPRLLRGDRDLGRLSLSLPVHPPAAFLPFLPSSSRGTHSCLGDRRAPTLLVFVTSTRHSERKGSTKVLLFHKASLPYFFPDRFLLTNCLFLFSING
jgi:hypothetical protein